MGLLAACWLAVAVPGYAQPSAGARRSRGAAIEVTTGANVVVDDGFAYDALVGGGARFYLLPRVSIGPELTYIPSPGGIHDFQAFGTVTFDLLVSNVRRQVRITPFFVLGGGVRRFDDGEFVESSGGIAAGVGLRWLATDRVHVAAEFGVRADRGRIAVTAGVRLGQ